MQPGATVEVAFGVQVGDWRARAFYLGEATSTNVAPYVSCRTASHATGAGKAFLRLRMAYYFGS